MQRTAAIVAEENLEQGDHFKIPRSKPAVATNEEGSYRIGTIQKLFCSSLASTA
jgi:hypothetical protein